MTAPLRWALGHFSGESGPFVGIISGPFVRDLRNESGRLSVADLTSTTATRSLLEKWDSVFPTLDALASERSTGIWVPVESLAVLAPIEPRQVLQAGANYRKHVIDLAVAHAVLSDGRTEREVRDETAAMMDKRKAEGIPYFFIGLPSAISGPYDTVILPSYSQSHDWELELAAVIGTLAYNVSATEALDHVAAFTIVNDLTTRDLVFRKDMPEIGTDWYRAKNAPGFLPTGPWLVPSAFVKDPQSVVLTLKLNGEVMQNELATDMLFTVAELVAAASQTTPLLPGDLILTGSPAGNGAHWGRLLRSGDVMESTITGLGTQRTPVVSVHHSE
jgi:2,4-diketo-3-deoxy-L-fuconate hydrolase